MATNHINEIGEEIREALSLQVSASAASSATLVYRGCAYDALNIWASKIAYWTFGELKIPDEIPQPPKAMAFLKKCFAIREELYKAHTGSTDKKIVAFKKEILELVEKDESLKECSSMLTSEVSFGIGQINSFAAIKALISPYYKLKAEGGSSFFRDMGEVFLISIRSLIEGKKVDERIFKEDMEPVKSMVLTFETIFNKCEEETKKRLIHLFKDLMKSIICCIGLCRFPVIVSKENPPIYFGHFLASVKILPYFEYLGVPFHEVCVILN